MWVASIDGVNVYDDDARGTPIDHFASPQAAKAFVQANNPVGVHLFENKVGATGQNGRLGVQFGINGLPTMFLIGRDGRVLNRTLQIGDLDEALRKAL